MSGRRNVGADPHILPVGEAESALEVRQILEMLGISDDDEPVRFDDK